LFFTIHGGILLRVLERKQNMNQNNHKSLKVSGKIVSFILLFSLLATTTPLQRLTKCSEMKNTGEKKVSCCSSKPEGHSFETPYCCKKFPTPISPLQYIGPRPENKKKCTFKSDCNLLYTIKTNADQFISKQITQRSLFKNRQLRSFPFGEIHLSLLTEAFLS